MSKKTLFGHEWQRDVKAIWGLFFLLLALSALIGVIGGWLYVSRDLDVDTLTRVKEFFRLVFNSLFSLPWDSDSYPDPHARKVFLYGPAISMSVFVLLWSGAKAIEWRNKQREREGV